MKFFHGLIVAIMNIINGFKVALGGNIDKRKGGGGGGGGGGRQPQLEKEEKDEDLDQHVEDAYGNSFDDELEEASGAQNWAPDDAEDEGDDGDDSGDPE